MGPTDRRTRERETTRGRIMDAAREMFAERGYEAVTMRAIAERIEYTPTAIYHHFRDKDELLSEVCAHDFLSLAAEFRSLGKVADPIERIFRTGRTYIRFALEHPNHYRTMFMTPIPHDPKALRIERRNPDQDAYGFVLKTVEEGIVQGRFRPELKDPEMLAQMFWAGVHGIASLHIAKGNDDWVEWRDAEATSELMCRAIFRGVLRDPGKY
jgi:AcrR family transcriptional regulator